MKQKHLDYLAPEAEILVVRFEGVICVSDPGLKSFSTSNGTVVTDDDDWD